MIGSGVPETLQVFPVCVVRAMPRERYRVPRAEGGQQGYREGHAVVLRRVLHAEAQHLEQEGGQGVDR